MVADQDRPDRHEQAFWSAFDLPKVRCICPTTVRLGEPPISDLVAALAVDGRDHTRGGQRCVGDLTGKFKRAAPKPCRRAASAVEGQLGAVLSRPKLAPSGSLTIAKRPPGNSWGESISFAPRSIAFRKAASTSSTVK